MGFNLFVTKKMIMRRSRDEFKVKNDKKSRPCLALEFFSKFACYKFFKNFIYSNFKKLPKFLNYTFQNIQKKHTSKFFFLKTCTISYSKILDKHLKNLLAKQGPRLGPKFTNLTLQGSKVSILKRESFQFGPSHFQKKKKIL